MSVKVKREPRLMSNSETIIHKIILHSKEEASPKFLKYIQHARKSFSSSCLKKWMELRTKGGLQAIENMLRNLVDVEFLASKSSPVDTTKRCRNSTADNQRQVPDQKNTIQKDVLLTGLSVVANAYSLDYAARRDVSSKKTLRATSTYAILVFMCLLITCCLIVFRWRRTGLLTFCIN